jgi:hypothetical protein
LPSGGATLGAGFNPEAGSEFGRDMCMAEIVIDERPWPSLAFLLFYRRHRRK